MENGTRGEERGREEERRRRGNKNKIFNKSMEGQNKKGEMRDMEGKYGTGMKGTTRVRGGKRGERGRKRKEWNVSE